VTWKRHVERSAVDRIRAAPVAARFSVRSTEKQCGLGYDLGAIRALPGGEQEVHVEVEGLSRRQDPDARAHVFCWAFCLELT
jgi:hypothetical protein